LKNTHLVCGNLHLDLPGKDAFYQSGDRAKLQPRALAVLLYLASRANQLVSRDELNSVVWGKKVVEPNALDQAIFQIRLALGDHDRQILVSVPRRGFELRMPLASHQTLEPERLDVNAVQVDVAAQEPPLLANAPSKSTPKTEIDLIAERGTDAFAIEIKRLSKPVPSRGFYSGAADIGSSHCLRARVIALVFTKMPWFSVGDLRAPV
jgi:DNA-binding winged helix-turn-helix (wHTH) protein